MQVQWFWLPLAHQCPLLSWGHRLCCFSPVSSWLSFFSSLIYLKPHPSLWDWSWGEVPLSWKTRPSMFYQARVSMSGLNNFFLKLTHTYLHLAELSRLPFQKCVTSIENIQPKRSCPHLICNVWFLLLLLIFSEHHMSTSFKHSFLENQPENMSQMKCQLQRQLVSAQESPLKWGKFEKSP